MYATTVLIIAVFLTRTIESAPMYHDQELEDFLSWNGEIAAPHEIQEFKEHLTKFLAWYYEQYVNPEGNTTEVDAPLIFDLDQMQSDQPEEILIDSELPETASQSKISPDMAEHLRITRLRNKDIWIQTLKDSILRKIGRTNTTMPTSNDVFPPFNLSQFLPVPNETYIDEESIGEKIRSYYPSCELPKNTDQDLWKDENAMNLFFGVEQSADENGISIATATLRLYRIPQQNSTTTSSTDSNCDNSSAVEDDKLLRVSIYWYTKSLKKHRVKRRLSDSKVIGESAHYVELSVRPATRAWSKGRNLGLAVLVEDQEGTLLKAEKYFKGPSCTVGTSTPKPIPTVIVDAARRAELERSNGANGTNATAALHNYVSLLPKIDICTLEFPQNFCISSAQLSNLRINKCNLANTHTQTQKLLENDRIEKLAALAGYSPPSTTQRHIRHQRQHFEELSGDPRSRMVGQKIILTNQELMQYNAQLANKNFTIVNR